MSWWPWLRSSIWRGKAGLGGKSLSRYVWDELPIPNLRFLYLPTHQQTHWIGCVIISSHFTTSQPNPYLPRNPHTLLENTQTKQRRKETKEVLFGLLTALISVMRIPHTSHHHTTTSHQGIKQEPGVGVRVGVGSTGVKCLVWGFECGISLLFGKQVLHSVHYLSFM